MSELFSFHSPAFKKFAFFAACLILCSMFLHEVVHHEHPHFMDGGGEIHAALHGQGKKYLAVLFVIFTALYMGAILRAFFNQAAAETSISQLRAEADAHRIFDFLFLFLRGGLLHPKIY